MNYVKPEVELIQFMGRGDHVFGSCERRSSDDWDRSSLSVNPVEATRDF